MSNFTLDNIRAAADAKYASTSIEVSESDTVVLLNPLRLTKERRAALSAIQTEMSGDDDEDAAEVDQVDAFQRSIRCVADSKRGAELLITAIGDDLATLAEVFETYGSETQVGEASASAS
ncbi:phage tail assembly protein [Rhodococcus antarcticus]|uniref:Phage tail assembly protein n=1 Tax=Rhodococcus antarcticus TaxID=2987751 RepID=A0ABY6NWE5_9NOCA|nr:phage tail assembly protein [Rhodococcus antarcticus]UZJ23715.1 phage tail assembly protein [Rhodococcus antarcticus]